MQSFRNLSGVMIMPLCNISTDIPRRLRVSDSKYQARDRQSAGHKVADVDDSWVFGIHVVRRSISRYEVTGNQEVPQT